MHRIVAAVAVVLLVCCAACREAPRGHYDDMRGTGTSAPKPHWLIRSFSFTRPSTITKDEDGHVVRRWSRIRVIIARRFGAKFTSRPLLSSTFHRKVPVDGPDRPEGPVDIPVQRIRHVPVEGPDTSTDPVDVPVTFTPPSQGTDADDEQMGMSVRKSPIGPPPHNSKLLILLVVSGASILVVGLVAVLALMRAHHARYKFADPQAQYTLVPPHA
ncbi:Uncharacterized protein PBTT_06204 [Plasmodiophora brassicae]|uniref:Uncharacterized protein n=1 Tax=Plasmodiophora brassicae TaxID=37360 RepID=A0A3P3YEG3_PLABS|nr:unnamed protein product [Plasmodiophora brassicae]